jgi:3-dehydroquinate synthase
VPTISEAAGQRLVYVNLADRGYDIHIGRDLLSSVAELAAPWLEARFGPSTNRSALIVTDGNVAELASRVERSLTDSGWRTATFSIPAGEPSKSIEVASRGWDRLVEFAADRRTVVFAVGGGVVGDAAGFIAATFVRGLPFIQVPTTLLAMVDSSVGGKVGINHPRAKNLIGAFHQPLGVVIDTATLSTLPEREYRAGMAEVIKYGVILDDAFFAFLEENAEALNRREPDPLRVAISRSCELKAQVVEEDEFETTGLRAVLNYGHTFAHAFEALCGYGELLHGEAVAIGMVFASRLAEKLGRIEAEVTRRQVQLLEKVGLPVALPQPETIRIDDVLDRMKLDKKTVGGTLRFVLPTRLGEVELVSGVPEPEVREVLRAGGCAE